jgi:hypothetical protein
MESRQPPPINGGLNQQYRRKAAVHTTNGISWSITNKSKAIQFPTGKEIIKPVSLLRRGQVARLIGYG